MLKAKIRLSVLLLLVFVTVESGAQKLWTLDECLDYALQHNLSLKQKELAVEQASIGLVQARMQRYPSLNGSASNVNNFGRSIDPLTNENVQRNSANLRFGLNASVVLFNGFRIYNNIQQQQYLVQASRFDEEVAKKDLGMSIANAFLQVLFAKELVKVNNSQKDATRLQLERTEKYFEYGKVSESAVLDLKAQLANDNLSLVNANNQEWMARVTLFQLLMLSPDSNDVQVPAVDEVPDAGVMSASHLLAMYEQHAPELKAADKRVKAGMYAWKVAKAAYYPTISINGSLGNIYSNQAYQPIYGNKMVYQQYYDANGNPISLIPIPVAEGKSLTSFGTQMNNNFGQTVSLSLNIPILNNYANKAGVKRAEINYETSILNKQIAANTIEQSVTQAYNEYLSAKAKYEASKASFEAQEASLQYAEKRRNEDLISSVEYNIILNNRNAARSNYIQAKYELMFRYKIIDFYKHGTVYPEVH